MLRIRWLTYVRIVLKPHVFLCRYYIFVIISFDFPFRITFGHISPDNIIVCKCSPITLGSYNIHTGGINYNICPHKWSVIAVFIESFKP